MIEAKDNSIKANPNTNFTLSKAKKTKKCPIFCEPVEEGKRFVVTIHGEPDNDKRLPEDIYNEKLCELTGTENKELANDIIKRTSSSICGYENYYEKNNIVLQCLAEQQPKDAHEARLCTQAVALYCQGMEYLERARSVLFDDGTIAKQDWHTILMKTATKLLDLHTKTIAELTRYKQNGEQRIVVQHVQVNDGGQAIVGDVLNVGVGVSNKNDEVIPC